jgi:hypothetical protein
MRFGRFSEVWGCALKNLANQRHASQFTEKNEFMGNHGDNALEFMESVVRHEQNRNTMNFARRLILRTVTRGPSPAPVSFKSGQRATSQAESSRRVSDMRRSATRQTHENGAQRG